MPPPDRIQRAWTEEYARQRMVEEQLHEHPDEPGYGFTECERCGVPIAIVEHGAPEFCPDCDPEFRCDPTREPSRLFMRYLELLQSGRPISHQQALSLAHYQAGRGKKHSMSYEEVRGLASVVEQTEGGIPMDKESTTRGLRWLRNLSITPKGRRRKRCPFTTREFEMLMHDPLSIALVGFVYGRPVYEVSAPDREPFRYFVGSTAADLMTGSRASRNPRVQIMHAPIDSHLGHMRATRG